MPSAINANLPADNQPAKKSDLRGNFAAAKRESEHGGFCRAPLAAAVERKVADKLVERISVKDFGAKGDGRTDDTTAIAAADKAAAVSGGRVVFAPGTYVCANLVVASDIEMQPGAKLAVSGSSTVRLKGGLVAGRCQIFAGGARSPTTNGVGWSCPVIGNAKISRLYPEWWRDPSDANDQIAFISMKLFASKYWKKDFPITIDCESGRNYRWAQLASHNLTNFPWLIVEGNGAFFEDPGNGFFVGAEHDDQMPDQFKGIGSLHFSSEQKDRNRYLIDDVDRGADMVALQDVAAAADFDDCQWVLVLGYAQMGYGYPPNPHFFEFVPLAGRDDRTLKLKWPLRNSYRADWPEQEGNQAWYGRARVIPYKGMSRVEVRNLRTSALFYAVGCEDALIEGVTAREFFCSDGVNYVVRRCRSEGLTDFDKINDKVSCFDCHFDHVWECTGVNQLLLERCKIDNNLNVGPRQLRLNNCDIEYCQPIKFSYMDLVDIDGGFVGVVHTRDHILVDSFGYTLKAGEYKDGVLTKANYLQDAAFLSFLYKAVPGSWVAVAGEKGALGRVLAVVQNGSSVSMSFSFIREPVPTARLYPMQIDRLRVRNLVPGCTATPGNGVVSAEIDVDGILADGEQGVLGVRADPLSITYRCQGDLPQHGHLEIPCGRTTAVEVDVAKPDGLAEVAANLILVGTSGTHGYRRFGTVNLKRAGRRVFTIGGSVTGLQPGDANNLADLPNGWLDSLYVEYNWPGPRNPAQRAIYAIRVKVWNPLIA